MDTTVRKQRHYDILMAAQLEFSERGFNGTKIEDIAKRAGIGKSTVYEYFPSKEEIMVNVLEMTISQFREVVSRTMSVECPLKEKLSNLFREGNMLLRDVFLLLHDLPEDCAPAFQYFKNHDMHNDPALDVLEQAIKAAIATGEVRSTIDTQYTARLLVLLMMASMHASTQKNDAGAFAKASIELLFEGIAP